MNYNNALVLGGDKRMVVLADMLAEIMNSYLYCNSSTSPKAAVLINSLSEIRQYDIAILPIPSFDKNGLLNGSNELSAEKLFASLPCSTLIFGAKISELHKHIAKEYGHKLIDYGENEKFNMYNAIPTAEAAILIAMENSEYTVNDSEYVVIGYGRIGKVLSKRLKELGGKVTVVSRNEKSLALSECEGHTSLPLKVFCDDPKPCNVCFNTVPSTILKENEINRWTFDKYIELASFPGGLSDNAIQSLNEKYISALSLPGKYFPVTSGRIIYKTIMSILASLGGN